MPLPEKLRRPPELADEYRVYWTAFIDLLSETRGTSKMLPWTAINQMAQHIGIPTDDLKYVIWHLDYTVRQWWKAREGST